MRACLFTLLLLTGCDLVVSPDCTEKQATTSCACYQNANPVCGCNGQTYQNACVASCVGVRYVAGACRASQRE